MKKALILILSLTLLLLLSGCKNAPGAELRLSDTDLSSTDEIRMQNAHNGQFTVITDPDDIAAVTAFVQSFTGTDPGSGKGYYEGSYSVAFYQGEEKIFSMAFGDSDCFYMGDYGDGYPIRYLLDDMTVKADVIPFLAQFDSSGFQWNG